MGNYQCQKVDSEEETISRLLVSMPLNEIELRSTYKEFEKCIKEGILDYFLFKAFIDKVVGESPYSNCQKNFFEKIRINGKDNRNKKKIGIIIIFLSKANSSERIDFLIEHCKKYYGTDELSVRDLVWDTIELNTDNCLFAFKDNVGKEGIVRLIDIWKTKRKRKLLNLIMNNYVSVSRKHGLAKGLQKLHSGKSKWDSESENGDKEILVTNCENFDKVKELKKINLDLEDFKRHIPTDNDTYQMKLKIKEYNAEFLNHSVNPISEKNPEEETLKDFFDLSYPLLNGDYIRNFLYEEYMKERTYDNSCFK